MVTKNTCGSVLVFVIIVLGSYIEGFEDLKVRKNNGTDIGRNARQFWIPFGFGLVRFANSDCNGDGGLVGTCLTRRECNVNDGLGQTSCANRAGVCCVFQRTCGESSSLNNTYFVSPGFPRSYVGSSTCTYVIQKQNDACQIRIDFLALTLAQPNANGTCATDALIVSGGGSQVPVICGENSGQHVYVEFSGNNSITISIVTGASTTNRAWNLKVAQINCNSRYKAPSGCLQFYRTVSGTVRSFNYGTTGVTNGTRQLANVNYGICVQMQPSYCGIQWAQTSDVYSFSVSGDTNVALTAGTVGTNAALITGTNCNTDFVVIPAPMYTNGTVANTDRFCGNGFVRVLSFSKPFTLYVVANSNEVNETGNRGFTVSYTQQACSGLLLLAGKKK